MSNKKRYSWFQEGVKYPLRSRDVLGFGIANMIAKNSMNEYGRKVASVGLFNRLDLLEQLHGRRGKETKNPSTKDVEGI